MTKRVKSPTHDTEQTFGTPVQKQDGKGRGPLPERGESPHNSFFFVCSPPAAASKQEGRNGAVPQTPGQGLRP